MEQPQIITHNKFAICRFEIIKNKFIAKEDNNIRVIHFNIAILNNFIF